MLLSDKCSVGFWQRGAVHWHSQALPNYRYSLTQLQIEKKNVSSHWNWGLGMRFRWNMTECSLEPEVTPRWLFLQHAPVQALQLSPDEPQPTVTATLVQMRGTSLLSTAGSFCPSTGVQNHKFNTGHAFFMLRPPVSPQLCLESPGCKEHFTWNV